MIGKKRIGVLMFSLLYSITAVIPTAAQSNMPRLVDTADLLTDSEESELLAELDAISEKQQVDVVAITEYTLDGKSPEAYADDFYDENGYRDDGILLLISMEDRDWWISTKGFGIKAFTDAGIDYMSEQFLGDLGSGYYKDAIATYARLCDAFITQANNGKPFDVGNMPKEPFNVPVRLAIAVGIGFVISLIITLIMKGKLKSVHFEAGADNYIKQNSMHVREKSDQFLYKHTERRAKPKDTGSGGSSTHSSSSGSSHGGGGGKF